MLLTHGLLAKVSDFGLSRNMTMSVGVEDEACYYKISTSRPLPIRWIVRKEE